MAHNLAMNGGTANIAYYGEVPWHKLGLPLNKPATAAEMIVAAQLNWEVEHRLVMGSSNNRYELIRKARPGHDEVDVQLGRCTRSYNVLQNDVAFNFLDGLATSGQVEFHTAGALGDGEVIWALVKLPNSIVVKGNDIVDKYLLLSNSHNGSESVTIKFTPIRVVCNNTLNAAMRDGNTAIRLKHTASLQSRLADVPDLLGISHDVFSYMEELYTKMANTQMTGSSVRDYMNRLIPLTPGQQQKRITDGLYPARWAAILDEFEKHDIPETKGTMWALYQAFTHYIDYAKSGRSGADDSARLKRVWCGAGAELKLDALQLAMV